MAAADLPVFQRNKSFKLDIDFVLAFPKTLVTLHPDSEIVETLKYTARNSKDNRSELLESARCMRDSLNFDEAPFRQKWSMTCVTGAHDYDAKDLQRKFKNAGDIGGDIARWNIDIFKLSSELYRTHDQRQEGCKILNEVDTGDGVCEPSFCELRNLTRIFQDNPAREDITHYTVLLEKCGLHLHIGVAHLSLEALKMLALITIIYEDVISELHPLHRRPARADKSGNVETNRVAFFRLPEAIGAEGDRNSHGTTVLHETLTLIEIDSHIQSQRTKSDLVDLMSAGGHKSLIDWSNVQPVEDTPSEMITFRQHQSTFNVEHILYQIQFCERLVRVAELYYLRGEGCGIDDKAWAAGKISLDDLFKDMLLGPQAIQHFTALKEKYRPAAENEMRMHVLFDPKYLAAQEEARLKREAKDKEAQDALPPVHLTPCDIKAHSSVMQSHWNEIAPGEMCPETLVRYQRVFYIKYHSMKHWDVLDPVLDDIVPRTRSIAAVLDSLRYQYPNEYQDLVDRHRREDLMREYASRVWHEAYDVAAAMFEEKELLSYWLLNLCNGLYGVKAHGDQNFMLVICDTEISVGGGRDQAWRVNDYTAFCRHVYVQAMPLEGAGPNERVWKAMKRKGWTAPAVTSNYKPGLYDHRATGPENEPLTSRGLDEGTNGKTTGHVQAQPGSPIENAVVETIEDVSSPLGSPGETIVIPHPNHPGDRNSSMIDSIIPYSHDFPDVTISPAGVLGAEEHAIASEYAIFVNYHSMRNWEIIDVPSRNANREGNLCGLYAIRSSLKHQYPAEWPIIEEAWSEEAILHLLRQPTIEQRSSWLPGAELHHDNFSELQLGMAVALLSPQVPSGTDIPPFRLVVCTTRDCPSQYQPVDRACRVAYDPNRPARNVYIYHKASSSNGTQKYWTMKNEPQYNHWQAMRRLTAHEKHDGFATS